ncbi:MAG: UDP-N-acetylmuramoyl-tripeptide--D-alanyl-D-alanine ligase [Actinobacteria bacterium]|nr:UDP-N-acetylmuramoyl-tripeptide--D-alanyl-D-alanine ligase [Actinomycetota bacterium]
MDLELLAHTLGARLVGSRRTIEGLSIDSRTLRPGQLFAAVRGERDGHDFVADAVAAGAGACLVERVDAEALSGTPALVVDSVSDALAALARLARDRIEATAAGRVVGVTGSVGKTTTKDLLASVLRQQYLTAASEKSFNNELGVPLTLANAPDDVEALVVEMGARGDGHIRTLCDLARPSVAVVTLVAAVHSEFMGGLDRIAATKGELVESLPAGGVAVLNADDERVAAMASHTASRVLTFGDGGDVRAEDVRLDAELRATFTLRTPDGSIPVHLGVRGEHNVTNALAAAAAAWALGVDIDGTAAGLAAPELSPWRMELVRPASGAVLLNDSYNANPTSMTAALRALAEVDATRRVAVLGYMAELDDAVAEHRRVAEVADQLGIEVVAFATDLYGVDPVEGIDAAVSALGSLGPGDAVLIKASRSVGLERLVAAIS